MYHTHEATERHDKIFALLGMCSDDLGVNGLSPDYQVSWKELLQQLVKFLLGKQVSVETWNDREMAIIDARGYVLGQVSSIESDQDGRLNVNINFKNPSQHLGHAHWNLHASPKSVQKGDIVCLIQGASKPTIIRRHEDHFAVIAIAATSPEATGTESDSDRSPDLLRDFSLVWNWENPSDGLQDQEEYTTVEVNRLVPERSQKELEDYMRKATGLYDVALILEDLEEYTEAETRLREAIKRYERALGKKHLHTLGLIDALGMIYRKSRQWKKAEKLFLQLIQTRNYVQGEEHLDTFRTLANLVSTYRDQGYLKGLEKLEVIADLVKRKECAARVKEEEVVRITESSLEVITLLLDRRGDDVPITEAVVKAAVRNKKSGKEIITLLFDQRGGDIPVTKGVIKEVVKSWKSEEIMTLLFDQKGGGIPITEEVVKAAAGNYWNGKEIITFLLDQKGNDISITEEVIKAAAGNG